MTINQKQIIIILSKGNKPKREKGEHMEDMKEFVAYARKLLRVLTKIEIYLEDGETEKALELVKELKEDTEKDVEA